MTGTVPIYRNDRRRPTAEIRLTGGDRVILALHAGGLLIEGGVAGGQRRVLFRGDAETVACVCAAMSLSPDLRSSPLDRPLGIAVHFNSAKDMAAAIH